MGDPLSSLFKKNLQKKSTNLIYFFFVFIAQSIARADVRLTTNECLIHKPSLSSPT